MGAMRSTGDVTTLRISRHYTYRQLQEWRQRGSQPPSHEHFHEATRLLEIKLG